MKDTLIDLFGLIAMILAFVGILFLLPALENGPSSVRNPISDYTEALEQQPIYYEKTTIYD